MTTPRTNQTPPRSPHITRQVTANVPPRRISQVLALSTGYPRGPTLAVLTIGGPSHMSASLIEMWQGDALNVKCNFCAIEVGEAPDTGLPELLQAHVPQGAHLYLVQRDAKVSVDEIEEVREVLDRLEIPLASDEVLNADDRQGWEFPVLDEVLRPKSGEPVDDDDDAAVKQQVAQDHAKCFEMYKEIDQLRARLAMCEPSSIGAGQQKPTAITQAFNELQFSKHWQAAAGSAGAKVVCEMVRESDSQDEATQRRIEGPLHTLLLGMRDDPDTLRAVLEAAEKLTGFRKSVLPLARMCMVYMEHQVASGALDDQPLAALDFARSVQRYSLLEHAYLSKLKALQDLQDRNSKGEVLLSMAFAEALIDVLRDGGQRGLSLQRNDMKPEEAAAAAAVATAWQDMLKQGNEGFLDFLALWTPWQALITRRQAQLAAESKPQHAMN